MQSQKKFPSNGGGAKKGPDFPRISTLSRLSIRYPRPLVSKYSELDFAPYKVIQGSLGFRIWGTGFRTSWIPDSLSLIFDSKAQDFRFHRQNFPEFWNSNQEAIDSPAEISWMNCYAHADLTSNHWFPVTFCCCLCDCRIPKTGYDSKNDPEEDSDCSDVEQLVATPRQGHGEKVSTNGFTHQKSQLRTTGHETGKMNKGFDSEGEIPSKSDNWRDTPRVTFSRQP